MLNKIALVFVLVMGLSDCLTAEIVKISKAEEQNLIGYLLPLPHEIAISEKIETRPEDISFRLRDNASEVEKNGLRELKKLFGEKGESRSSGKKFEILLGIIDKNGLLEGVKVNDFERIKKVPNQEQAYIIQPVEGNKLLVAALNDRGVFYGAMTLCQLLKPGITEDKISVPLATILDWPDMEERGFWHMPLNQIPWLATMKFNYFHSWPYFSFKPDGTIELGSESFIYSIPKDDKDRGSWSVPYAKARLYAAEVVPGILHLDMFERETVIKHFAETYPELLGKGESAKSHKPGIKYDWQKQRCLCATNPLLADVLAEMMKLLASQGAAEVNVWQTEYPGLQCACEKCMKVGQFQAEYQATISAWKKACKTYPNLRLRVFYGSGGYYEPNPIGDYPVKAMKEIFDSLPLDVRFAVSGGIAEETLINFAARGGWCVRHNMGRIDSWYRYFSGDLVKRLKYFHEKHYRGGIQFFPSPEKYGACIKEFDYQISALAEYSWNVNGRSRREFDTAWATQQGYNLPGKFGEWAELMLPPQEKWRNQRLFWYSSCWFKELPKMIREQKRPELPLEAIESRITACEKALELAGQLEPKDLIWETQVSLEFYRLEKQGLELVNYLLNAKPENKEDLIALHGLLENFKKAKDQYIEAINIKIKHLSPSLAKIIEDDKNMFEKLFTEILQELAKKGVE